MEWQPSATSWPWSPFKLWEETGQGSSPCGSENADCCSVRLCYYPGPAEGPEAPWPDGSNEGRAEVSVI